MESSYLNSNQINALITSINSTFANYYTSDKVDQLIAGIVIPDVSTFIDNEELEARLLMYSNEITQILSSYYTKAEVNSIKSGIINEIKSQGYVTSSTLDSRLSAIHTVVRRSHTVASGVESPLLLISGDDVDKATFHLNIISERLNLSGLFNFNGTESVKVLWEVS